MRNNSLKISEIRSGLPSLTESAACAAKLREAMFDGVTQNDITEIMKSFVAKAKAGDAKAAKLVFDVVSASAPKTTFSVGVRTKSPDRETIGNEPTVEPSETEVAAEIAEQLGKFGPMTLKELVDHFGNDRGDIDGAVDEMLELGYLDRGAGADRLRLTSLGRKQLID